MPNSNFQSTQAPQCGTAQFGTMRHGTVRQRKNIGKNNFHWDGYMGLRCGCIWSGFSFRKRPTRPVVFSHHFGEWMHEIFDIQIVMKLWKSLMNEVSTKKLRLLQPIIRFAGKLENNFLTNRYVVLNQTSIGVNLCFRVHMAIFVCGVYMVVLRTSGFSAWTFVHL